MVVVVVFVVVVVVVGDVTRVNARCCCGSVLNSCNLKSYNVVFTLHVVLSSTGLRGKGPYGVCSWRSKAMKHLVNP